MKKIRVNEHEFNVIDEGEGPPILFAHGFPLNHSMWQGQIDVLSAQHRVIAPDLRGFGESGVTEGTITMEELADDLNLLLDVMEITDKITYCGLSMGGYIGWPFIQKYGDRLSSLILCDTRAGADTEEGAATRNKMADQVMIFGPKPALRTMLPKLVSKKTNEGDSDIIGRLREMIINTKRKSIAAALRGMGARPDSTSLLPEIKIPTLAIVGAEDTISTSEEMKQMSEMIPNAEFVEVADAGHMSPMEDPERVNVEILYFLETVL